MKGRDFWVAMRRWAVLPLRLVVGYGFVAHGVAKYTRGATQFADILQKLGVPAPHLAAWGTIIVECVGGVAVLTGTFIPIASIPLVTVLFTPVLTVHVRYGFSSIKLRDVTASGPLFGMPGYELDLLYIAALWTLAFCGPGPYTLGEAFTRLQRWIGKNALLPNGIKADDSGVNAGRATSSSIRLRTALPEDAVGIASRFLESAAYHAHFDERYATPSFESIAKRYREGRQHQSARENEAITLVAERKGAIVGFVDARLEKSCDPMHRDVCYCYVADIAVAPQYQGEGVGRRLLREAEEWGRQKGAEFASLEYHVANERAGKLYQEGMSYRVVSMFAIKRL